MAKKSAQRMIVTKANQKWTSLPFGQFRLMASKCPEDVSILVIPEKRTKPKGWFLVMAVFRGLEYFYLQNSQGTEAQRYSSAKSAKRAAEKNAHTAEGIKYL